jgi:hypothetical protein
MIVLVNVFAIGERQLRELNANAHLLVGPVSFTLIYRSLLPHISFLSYILFVYVL